LPQRTQESLKIAIAPEDAIAMIATIDGMVDQAIRHWS